MEKMLELEKFIFNNPDNWKELLAEAPYYITIKQKDCKYIFNYNQILSDMSLPIVQECRGTILEIFSEEDYKYALRTYTIIKKTNIRSVCVPFFKFFNAEEPNSHLPQIDWSTAAVQEKIDGSLMKVYYDFSLKKWTVATNGTIDAQEAPASDLFSFRDLFDIAFRNATHMSLEDFGNNFLVKGITYMFELVSPHTRVVVPYNETKLYFLGQRDNASLLENSPADCLFAKYFDVPQAFPLSNYTQVREAATALPWDEEGYVVCDANFNRVKIKSPAYVEAHHCRNNGAITRKRLIDIIYNGGEDDFLVYADKAWRDEMIRLKSFVQADLENAAAYYRIFSSIVDQKEFAQAVSELPPHFQTLLFRMRREGASILKMTDFKVNFWYKILGA